MGFPGFFRREASPEVGRRIRGFSFRSFPVLPGKPGMRIHMDNRNSGGGFVPIFHLISVLMLVGFLLPGCGGSHPKRAEVRSTQSLDLEKEAPGKPKMAVLPFRDGTKFENPDQKNLCFLTRQVFKSGDVLPGSGIGIAEIFRRELARHGDYLVIPDWRVNEALFRSKKDLYKDYSLELGEQIGKSVGADTVLMGVVMRYERRVGSGVAPSKSAAVSFSVLILNVKTGETWWESRFEKTQEPLLNNLLEAGSFFKGGMKWQDAEDMVKIGIESMMDRFPRFPVGRS